jgi:hypothetical protein
MEFELINSFLLVFHFLLFIGKAWAISFLLPIYIYSSARSTRRMIVFRYAVCALLIFSVMMVFLELWYLYNFFLDIDLYYYEYFSVLDQIIFTGIGVLYFAKEGLNNGKR